MQDDSLLSKTPFYIDRKYRPQLTPSPRCLCFLQNKNHPQNDIFQDYTDRIRIYHKKYCKAYNNSQQLSPRDQAQQNHQIVEWNEKETQNFKQKLKALLQQYYQIEQQNQQNLNKKIKKQRQIQLQRIENSLIQLLISKKIVYKQMKQTQNQNKSYLNQIKTKNCEEKHSKIQSKNKRQNTRQDKQLRLVQHFARQFIQNQIPQKQNKVCKSIIQKGIQKFLEFNYQDLNDMRKLDQNLLNKTTQQFDIAKDQKDINSLIRAKKFLNKFKKNQLKESLQNISSVIESDRPIEGTHILQNSIQKETTKTRQGSEKFYKVIKQLLIKTKGKKQDLDFKPRTNQINNNTLKSAERFKNKTQKFFNRTKQSTKKLSRQNLKNNESIRNLLYKQKKVKQKIKLKQKSKNTQNLLNKLKIKPKQNQKPTPNKKNGNKNNKIKKQPINLKQKQLNTFEQSPQKIKKRTRTHKLGFNFTKLFGKLLKATQDQKQTISPQRLRYFKKLSTRPAFLKRKNLIILNEQFKNIKQVQSKQQNNLKTQDQNLSRKSSSSYFSEPEQVVKLTKYQQARLMYNMRNVKSRELISTMKNTGERKDHLKTKSPSFCIVNSPQQNQRSLNKQASIVRQRNFLDQQNLHQNQNQLGLGLLNSHKFPNSTRSFINSQTQLTDLTNYEQFNLKKVKCSITNYLKKFMKNSEKARQLYNFLMFMEESRKVTLQQQQINISLDQLQTQKQQMQIKNVVKMLDLDVDDYEGCNRMYQSINWNEKDLLTNKTFIDKLDARSIEIMYYNNQKDRKLMETLNQCSLKQIKDIPI